MYGKKEFAVHIQFKYTNPEKKMSTQNWMLVGSFSFFHVCYFDLVFENSFFLIWNTRPDQSGTFLR